MPLFTDQRSRLVAGGLIIPIALVSLWIGYRRGIVVQAGNVSARGHIIRENNSQWPHVHSILECDIIGGNERIAEYEPVKEGLQTAIDHSIAAHEADTVSVYLRTLNTGRWIGVNEDEKFSPASLLKVSTLISILKIAEEHPEILKETLYFNSDTDYDAVESIEPAHVMVIGRAYTIDELLTFMIVNSSNDARHVLNDYLKLHEPHAMQNLYDELNLPTPKTDDEIDFMSPKAYSSLFRILYNATYLDQAMSEKALQMLGQVTYTDGLVSGVPTSTFVAHKFGERSVSAADGTVTLRELHDCGIAYYPNHPYFICIMTKGKEFASLQKTIATLSSVAYHEIDSYFTALPKATQTTP